MTIHSQHPSISSLWQPVFAVLLLFLAGSTFSLGVFIPKVEAFATPTHHLDGVWETAMGAMHFLSAPIMIAASIYLDNGRSPHQLDHQLQRFASKTFRLRFLNVVSAVAFALFTISAHGAAHSNRFTLFFGVALQAFPLAILYLTCVQALLIWIPKHSGIAVGIGHVAFGLGTVGLAQLFSVLITLTNRVTAIYLSSAILAAGAVLPSILLKWPSKIYIAQHEEQDPLLQRFGPIEPMPLQRLVYISDFWLYVVAVFSTSASYMLNPYFFKLGHLFNRPLPQLVLLFNLGNLAATFCGLFGTALADLVGFGRGFFFSGSKNIMVFFMTMQSICFFLSIAVNNTLNFTGFVLVKTSLKIIVSCHVGCSALLARDLFGIENTCIAFGFGAGLALGCGEATSAWIMAAVDFAGGPASAPSDYNTFYWIAAVWSIIGLACILNVQRLKTTPSFEPCCLA